jgi:hypothetical protein
MRFLTFLLSLFCILGESLLHTKKVAAAAAAAVRVENERSAAAAATSAMDYMGRSASVFLLFFCYVFFCFLFLRNMNRAPTFSRQGRAHLTIKFHYQLCKLAASESILLRRQRHEVYAFITLSDDCKC